MRLIPNWILGTVILGVSSFPKEERGGDKQWLTLRVRGIYNNWGLSSWGSAKEREKEKGFLDSKQYISTIDPP